jgi:hypothetical protein
MAVLFHKNGGSIIFWPVINANERIVLQNGSAKSAIHVTVHPSSPSLAPKRNSYPA